jgi:hypothetical protein
MSTLTKDTRVAVLVIDNAPGAIINIRAGEEFGGTIYTVQLDDKTLTPSGIFYARPFEVREEQAQAAYAQGYRHGSDGDGPDTTGVSSREAYFDGYARGMKNQPHIVIPEWMTPKQVEAINTLYKRNPDGARNRHAFFSRVHENGIGSDKYAGINWCGMFVGIEPDGYTHT